MMLIILIRQKSREMGQKSRQQKNRQRVVLRLNLYYSKKIAGNRCRTTISGLTIIGFFKETSDNG